MFGPGLFGEVILGDVLIIAPTGDPAQPTVTVVVPAYVASVLVPAVVSAVVVPLITREVIGPELITTVVIPSLIGDIST